MTSLLGNVASILGMFGVMAFFVLLSVIIFRLIMYKENPNKRAEFMDGVVNLLAGLIIIGLMTVIVEMIYYYIQKIDPNMTSLIAQANTSHIKSVVNKMPDGSGSLLAGMISDLIAFILQGISSLFGLSTINQLLMPQNAQIFSSTGWSMIMGAYVILIVPAVILMLFMVFRTGLQFMMGGVNPKDMTKARSSIIRWVIVLFIIIFGEIIIRGICIIGSDFTSFFNSQLQLLMPNLSQQTSIFFGEHLGGEGLIGGIISMYMVYLRFRFNILFIIRDIMIIAFTIFTPIAATLWGIEPSTMSLKVWFGEIVSNALMAFCLSIGFLAFALTYDIFAVTTTNPGTLMLVTLVGLTMILKVGSTLRNSTQGILFQFSSLNEDKASKNLAGGGFVAGIAGGMLGKTINKAGGRAITETASKGIESIKDKLETSGYGDKNSKNESSKMDKVGEKAQNSANEILKDAEENGMKLDPKELTSEGKNGSVNQLSNEAIGLNFADKLSDNMQNGAFKNRKDATEAAKNDTISEIAKQYSSNPELRTTMPPKFDGNKKQMDSWARSKAENKFAEAIGSRSEYPVNHATVDKQGFEHFNADGTSDIEFKKVIENDQQENIGKSNSARASMNNAVESIGTGKFNSFDNNMADTISDNARADRYKDTEESFKTSFPKGGQGEAYGTEGSQTIETAGSTSNKEILTGTNEKIDSNGGVGEDSINTEKLTTNTPIANKDVDSFTSEIKAPNSEVDTGKNIDKKSNKNTNRNSKDQDMKASKKEKSSIDDY